MFRRKSVKIYVSFTTTDGLSWSATLRFMKDAVQGKDGSVETEKVMEQFTRKGRPVAYKNFQMIVRPSLLGQVIATLIAIQNACGKYTGQTC
jgi:hypothetical protein